MFLHEWQYTQIQIKKRQENGIEPFWDKKKITGLLLPAVKMAVHYTERERNSYEWRMAVFPFFLAKFDLKILHLNHPIEELWRKKENKTKTFLIPQFKEAKQKYPNTLFFFSSNSFFFFSILFIFFSLCWLKPTRLSFHHPVADLLPLLFSVDRLIKKLMMVRAMESVEHEGFKSRFFHFRGNQENAGRHAKSLSMESASMFDSLLEEDLSSRSQGSTPVHNNSAEKQQSGLPLAPSNRPEKALKVKLSSRDDDPATEKEARDKIASGP